MATIRRRGKEQWQVQVRVQGHPPQTKTFRTRADAERWSKAVESGISLGSFKPANAPKTVTLGQCLERYGRDVTPKKKGHVQELSILRRLGRLASQAADISHWRPR